MIKTLSEATAENLCAQQVITNISQCIKELIDNSIDAHARVIRIYLQEYGKKNIQIIDDGDGINDFSVLGKKGTSSKNKANQEISFLGFRGQAIHSLAKVSSMMKISTQVASDMIRREFNVKTLECTQTRSYSSTHFTKIEIVDLFANLPVRRNQLLTKPKQFLKRTNELIKQYCLIYPQIGFVLINNREGKEEALIETHSNGVNFTQTVWRDRIVQVYGNKLLTSLIFVQDTYVQGFVLNKIESGSSYNNDFLKQNIHYLYLNRRPIDVLPNILTTISDIYRKYKSSTKYVFIINLKIDSKRVDVNLTPNKRQVFIPKNIIEEICRQLSEVITKNVVEDVTKMDMFQEKKLEKIEKSASKKISRTDIIKNEENQVVVRQIFDKADKEDINNQRQFEKSRLSEHKQVAESKFKDFTALKEKANKQPINNQPNRQKSISPPIQINPPTINITISVPNGSQQTSSSASKETIRNTVDDTDPINSINKQDFKSFQIIGQFNNGFILSLCNDKIYLVDQHAASQKDHYETLIQKPLDRIVCNIEKEINGILADEIDEAKNLLLDAGFRYQIQDRSLLKLTRCPTLVNKRFDMQIFLEIVRMKRPLKQISSFMESCAMKACRSAVMVGDVLAKQMMQSICGRLAELQSPWNCPHGRPTLIELTRITAAKSAIQHKLQYDIIT